MLIIISKTFCYDCAPVRTSLLRARGSWVWTEVGAAFRLGVWLRRTWTEAMNVGLLKCQFKWLRTFFCVKVVSFFCQALQWDGWYFGTSEDSNLSLGIKIISWTDSTYTISQCLIVAFSFASSFLIILQGFFFFWFCFIIENIQIVHKLFSCLCQISH